MKVAQAADVHLSLPIRILLALGHARMMTGSMEQSVPMTEGKVGGVTLVAANQGQSVQQRVADFLLRVLW